MSKSIDERVVSMQFDNKQFEAGVKTSLSTIDKLKQSLNLTGATKGLENISKVAKSTNLSGLSSAVETVNAKFSALEVMAVTALANITNQAVNAGKKIAAALTIDPIKSGFQEYETQINAVQTILANTSMDGTTIEQVNKALAELNTYADKTIYNFTEMTRNIGTFTAAGVKLDTSVQAIKGIANLAAVSGSNAQQASTAMYQLSQAMASGTVKLMDWNSVVNAGMGGKVFQQALMETARIHGVAIDQMVADEGSFRETLTNGWLTTDVLTETLAKFTGDLTEAQLKSQGYTTDQIKEIIKLGEMANDAATKVKTITQLFDTLKEAAQSGWTQSWQLIVGDFDEAKAVLTDVSNVMGEIIGKSAEARNNMLSIGLSSGWNQFLSKGVSDVEGFKREIQSVAKAHGTTIEEMLKKESSVEGVTKRTSEIMTEALSNLTAKTRGLSDEQLEQLGYTREQITALEDLNESVQNGSVSMEEFANKMVKSSGRENLIRALSNSFNGLMSIVTIVKESFREIFPAYTGEQLYKLTERILALTEGFKLSAVQVDNVKRTFKGLFAVLDIGKQAFTAIVSGLSELVTYLLPAGDGLLSFTGSIGDWLVGIDVMVKRGDVFNTVIKTMVGFIKIAITSIKYLINAVKEKFNFPGFEILHDFLERIHTRMSQVGKSADDMKSGVVTATNVMGSALANSKVLKSLQAIWEGVKLVTSGIVNALGKLSSGLVESLGNADFSGVFDLINTLSFAGITLAIRNFLKNGIKKPFNGIQDILDSVKNVLDGVRSSLEAWQSNLKAGTLLKIAGAIGILAASILVISLIDSAKLTASLGAITVLFADLMASLAVFSKISGSMTGVVKASTSMISISIAVLILASALKKVGELSFGEMVTGLVGIIGLTTTMIAAAKIMGSGSSTIIKGSAQMVVFAVAINVLTSACKDLSELSWGELTKGLVGVGVLLAEVSLFLNTAKFSGKSIASATGIVILSAAIKILASAASDFGSMSWGEIGKGPTSIGILLAEISAFTNLTGNAKHVISTGLALIAIGAAMKIFASAVSDFGSMSWESIGKGLGAMGIALAEVGIAVNLMPPNLVFTAAGLIGVGIALTLLSKSLNSMGNMSWEGIAKGLVAMGGALAILSIGLTLMTGTLLGSASLLVAAAALAVLTPTLSILGAMSWEGIAKGLLTIAGAFAVLGVAGLVLTPLIPSILALSASFALIGVAVLGIGVGLLAAGTGLAALAVGFTALAVAGAGGATAVVAALTVIITGIAGLIPVVIGKIGEGVVAFAGAITAGSPAILEAFTTVLLAMIQAIATVSPVIIDTVVGLLITLLQTIAKYTPQFVKAVADIIVALLNGIADAMPRIILAGVGVIIAFLEGIAAANTLLVDAAFKMIIDFINGIADAIDENVDLLIDAGNNLGNSLVDAAVAVLLGTGPLGGVGKFIDAGKNMVAGFIDGITDLDKVSDAGAAMGNAALDGAKSKESLDEHSPSKSAEKIGENGALGFINGLAANIAETVGIGEDLGTSATDGISTGLDNGSEKVKKSAASVGAKAAKSLYDATKEWIDNRKFYDLLTLEEELAKWEEVQAKYKEGSEERIKIDKEAYTLKMELAKQEFAKVKELIDAEVQYGRLGKEEELAAWKHVQSQYEEGSDERIEITKKVYALEKEAAEETFDAIEEWITEREDQNKSSLNEELYVWKQVQKQFMEGTEERIKADKKVLAVEQKITDAKKEYAKQVAEVEADAAEKRIDLEEEYYESVKSVNDKLRDDIKDLNNAYDDAVKARANSLYSTYKLFDKVESKDAVSGTDLIDNLKSQITAIDSWKKNINELSGKGVAEGLIDELREMGPESAAEIQALNELTAEQLNQYVTLWQEKHNTVKAQATMELEGLKLETITKIAELNAAAAIELQNYKNTWYQKLSELNSETRNKLSELKAEFNTKMGQISNDTIAQVTGLVTAMNAKYKDFYDTGKYLVDGFAEGITANTFKAEAKAKAMAERALAAARAVLKIKSPSRAFYEIGDYAGQGFVNALGDYASKAYDASAVMAESAKNGLSNIISKIADVIDGNVDTQPTIRPVLDLSNVEAGASKLNALFSRTQAMNVSSNMSKLSDTAEIQNGVINPVGGNKYEFTQNNYSPKSLSRVEIYRQTRNQFSAFERTVKA